MRPFLAAAGHIRSGLVSEAEAPLRHLESVYIKGSEMCQECYKTLLAALLWLPKLRILRTDFAAYDHFPDGDTPDENWKNAAEHYLKEIPPCEGTSSLRRLRSIRVGQHDDDMGVVKGPIVTAVLQHAQSLEVLDMKHVFSTYIDFDGKG
ncbi:uncharacterized protein J7T54_000290 [Emericellopsis cladophorae]|uniref:Uncharacterized protein n=1 Tax=Emericellopsis cladophorae TaxID=2686198 RepID=A0A9P9XTJ4_9HYPO|nr:uncharacterized protein J7T54_000290 [Emericellopsis cladophorae]KAI6777601.1 hypothetical protein J7T54_000290 [Emericellopsis cladophorae]